MGMKEYVHVAFTSVHQEQIPPIPVNFKISFIFFSGLTISTSHHYSLSIFLLHSLYFFTCSFPLFRCHSHCSIFNLHKCPTRDFNIFINSRDILDYA